MLFKDFGGETFQDLGRELVVEQALQMVSRMG
jgi:hypothetical protein